MPMIDTPVGPIHWRDYGGEGPPLVLVHGLGGSIANWDSLAPRISAAGATTAIDLPGFGYSPPAQSWELATHVAAIESYVSQIGAPVTLIGNSLGGLLSEMVAAQRPELVERLVLISPATPPRLPDPLIHWPTARRLLVQATPGLGRSISKYLMRRYDAEELVHLTLASVTHDPSRIPDEMVEGFVELAERRRRLPWAADAVPTTGTSIAKLFLKPRNFVAMIRRIKAPTLVVHGFEDRLVSPTSVEWMCSLRPDWDLVQLDDTGHTPQLDAVDELASVVVPWLQASQMTRRPAELA